MANKTYTTTFALGGQLNSTFSKAFGQAQKEVAQLENKVNGAKIGKQFDVATKSIVSFRARLGDVVKVAGAAAAAIGGIQAIGGSLNKAMDFEAQIDAVASLDSSIRKGTQGYQDMQKLALKLGASTSYSALEAAQGMEELVKAGMPIQTMLNGGAEAALNLAAGGGVEVAEAAEVMAVAMNSFKKDGMSAAQAADILAGTANAAATGVNDLRFGIAAVGAVASGSGLTFKDTASAIGLFTNNGMQASDAGTSLKTMLMNLQPSTDAAYNAFDKLGLLTMDAAKASQFLAKQGIKPANMSVDEVTKSLAAYLAKMDGAKTVTGKYFDKAKDMAQANGWLYSSFYDANGQMKDMGQIAGLLRDKLSGLNTMQRQDVLKTMFGSDAIRAGNILFEEGAEGIQKFQAAMANTTALQAAKARMDNAKGAVEQFKGAMETLQISVLMPLMPTIKKVALATADFTGRLTEALDSDEVKQFGKQTRTVFGIVKKVIITGYQAALPAAQNIMSKLSGLFDTWLAAARPLIPSIRSIIGSVVSAIQQVIPVAIRLGATFGNAIGKILQVLIPVAGYISGTLWPIIAQIFQFLSTQAFPRLMSVINSLIPRVTEIGNKVIAAFQAIWGFVKPMLDGLVADFQLVWPIIKSVVLNAVDSIGGVLHGLMTSLGGVIDFITGVFSGNWSQAWQGIKDVFSGIFDGFAAILTFPINVAIDGINAAIRGINKVDIKVPDWVPKIGGQSFGFNIPEIGHIATYARGGFANQASIFGEAGLEVAIPIDGSERSRSLYETTGRLLGASGSTTNNTSSSDTFVYRPTIIIQGGADKGTVDRAVQAGNDDFEKRMDAWQQRRKRVSMAWQPT